MGMLIGHQDVMVLHNKQWLFILLHKDYLLNGTINQDYLSNDNICYNNDYKNVSLNWMQYECDKYWMLKCTKSVKERTFPSVLN